VQTVFDVGMYNGSDTEYYLELGFRVVAVEANLRFVERARKRFDKELAAGKLVLVHAAVVDQPGPAVLYLSGDDPGSSSISREWVESINPAGALEVEGIVYSSLLSAYGTPYFLKVDIEGADRHCVLALTSDARPSFLSFEIGPDFDELMAHVIDIGFNRFKIINQAGFRHIRNEDCLRDRVSRRAMHLLGYGNPTQVRRAGRFFRSGSSGPVPWQSDGEWTDRDRMLSFWRQYVDAGRDSAWYDIHATRAA